MLKVFGNSKPQNLAELISGTAHEYELAFEWISINVFLFLTSFSQASVYFPVYILMFIEVCNRHKGAF